MPLSPVYQAPPYGVSYLLLHQEVAGTEKHMTKTEQKNPGQPVTSLPLNSLLRPSSALSVADERTEKVLIVQYYSSCRVWKGKSLVSHGSDLLVTVLIFLFITSAPSRRSLRQAPSSFPGCKQRRCDSKMTRKWTEPWGQPSFLWLDLR